MKKEFQNFKFCLRCQRMALIQKKCCCFCGGDFILQGHKTRLNYQDVSDMNREQNERNKIKYHENKQTTI